MSKKKIMYVKEEDYVHTFMRRICDLRKWEFHILFILQDLVGYIICDFTVNVCVPLSLVGGG